MLSKFYIAVDCFFARDYITCWYWRIEPAFATIAALATSLAKRIMNVPLVVQAYTHSSIAVLELVEADVAFEAAGLSTAVTQWLVVSVVVVREYLDIP